MAEDVKYILRNCALNKGFMNGKKTTNWSVQGQLSGRRGIVVFGNGSREGIRDRSLWDIFPDFR